MTDRYRCGTPEYKILPRVLVFGYHEFNSRYPRCELALGLRGCAATRKEKKKNQITLLAVDGSGVEGRGSGVEVEVK